MLGGSPARREVIVLDEDEETFTADLELLAPVGERVGLILLASGPSTRVISPGSFLPDALVLVEAPLAHHEVAGPAVALNADVTTRA